MKQAFAWLCSLLMGLDAAAVTGLTRTCVVGRFMAADASHYLLIEARDGTFQARFCRAAPECELLDSQLFRFNFDAPPPELAIPDPRPQDTVLLTMALAIVPRWVAVDREGRGCLLASDEEPQPFLCWVDAEGKARQQDLRALLGEEHSDALDDPQGRVHWSGTLWIGDSFRDVYLLLAAGEVVRFDPAREATE